MIENNIIFTLDSYKDLHDQMLQENTTNVISYFESRVGAKYPYTVFFGLQYIIKKWLLGAVITKEMIDEAEPILKTHFKYNGDVWDRKKWDYIVEKHNGKLPIKIKAVKEGTKIPTGNVQMIIESTDNNCAWLTNAMETLLQTVWYSSTVCTRSNIICDIIKRYFKETVDDDLSRLADFYLHDFGQRATSGMEQAGIGGLAHLVNSKGTDSKMAIPYGINYYNAKIDDLCFSVPASEHSIQTALGEKNEFEVTKQLIKKFPNGILSVVSDSYDIEKAVDVYCNELKGLILQRNGKFVIRPDSPRFNGDTPENQILWIAKKLWDSFGGTINKKGYKVLDSHVGIIYGDSLTEVDIEKSLEILKQNGFSASTCVYGCGGYLLQKLNRDTQRMAFKCCAQVINGELVEVYKKPKDISKASKKGILKLIKKNGEYKTVNISDEGEDELELVFENGNLIKEYTFEEIRNNAK